MAGHDIQLELKKYKAVYSGLLILTVLNVGVNYAHFAVKLVVAFVLIIATVKASMVASFFMHLNAEKNIIYYLLIMVGFLLVSMMVLLITSHYSVYEGLEYVS